MNQSPQPTIVELIRRFCEDWLDKADSSVCEQIMDPGYRVEIGGFVFGRRDQYVPATMGQLEDFVGLKITPHEFFTNGEEAVLRFTEHGASQRLDGARAAWKGIAMFWSDGAKLVRNVTEEDYLSRRSQLSSDAPLPLEAALDDPWSTLAVAVNSDFAREIRTLIKAGELSRIEALVADDGRSSDRILDVVSTEIADLVSAGDSVGFRVLEHGTYVGGLGLPEDAVGLSSSLSTVGVIRRIEGVLSADIVRDRAGLRRVLASAVKDSGRA